MRGQKAEWGDVRVDPAVGSWYRDDRRCQLTLKELGRQKGAHRSRVVKTPDGRVMNSGCPCR